MLDPAGHVNLNARNTVIFAGVLGAVTVAAGAFGAHGLQPRVDADALEIWKTGTHYSLVHAVVLLALGLAGGPWTRARQLATSLLGAGCVIFSGTLYAMTLGAPRWLGAVTPLGGLCLIAGWCATAVFGWRALRGDPRRRESA
jgi:uncharacterized membrane protein YgdD (TMEM256/DUF423 family)